ncbi:unnamed protein product [Arctogadus glacialis]
MLTSQAARSYARIPTINHSSVGHGKSQTQNPAAHDGIAEVNHGGTKKWVKVDEGSFTELINSVQRKFLVPEDTELKVTDDQGIEVDEEDVPELATMKDVCFIISTLDDIPLLESSKTLPDCSNLTEFVTLDLTVLQQAGTSSSSLTDTVSISTSLSSDSDAGSQMSQPFRNSTHARNTMEQILTSAGMTD